MTLWWCLHWALERPFSTIKPIEGVRNIIRAMQAHGIRRLIYLSFIGIPESRSSVGVVLRYIAPIPLRHEIADHEAKEALIKASGLDWTIVRPPRLTDGPCTARSRRTRIHRPSTASTPLRRMPPNSRLLTDVYVTALRAFFRAAQNRDSRRLGTSALE